MLPDEDKGSTHFVPLLVVHFLQERDPSKYDDAEYPFDPILPEVPISTLEENEEEIIGLRARLYRYDSEKDPPIWKNRGTGNIKLLHHKTEDSCRVVMRSDPTFKISANHYITPGMELKPHCGSDLVWVYGVPADRSFEHAAREQIFAVKFENLEDAQKWEYAFRVAQTIVGQTNNGYQTDSDDNAER